MKTVKRKRLNEVWRIWKYAIGSFSDEQTEQYDDIVAIVRSVIVGVNLLCALFIVINIMRNWV